MIDMGINCKKICNDLIIWFTGGIIYFYMEIAFRGYSHYSMFICGGLCFLLVGRIGNRILRDEHRILTAQIKIMLFGSLVITTLEYITGVIVNLYFKLGVWDYSGYKYNVQGQICLIYSLLWALLSLPCVFMDGMIRQYIFEE